MIKTAGEVYKELIEGLSITQRTLLPSPELIDMGEEGVIIHTNTRYAKDQLEGRFKDFQEKQGCKVRIVLNSGEYNERYTRKEPEETPEDNHPTRTYEKKIPNINAPYPKPTKDNPYIEHSGNSWALGRAQKIIDDLKQGKQRMDPSVVIGDNGIGKTAFISWLMHTLKEEGISSSYLDIEDLSDHYRRTEGERFSRLDELKKAKLIAVDSLHTLYSKKHQRTGCQKTIYQLWNYALYNKRKLILAFTPNKLDFNSFLNQLENKDLASRLEGEEPIPIIWPSDDREKVIEKLLSSQGVKEEEICKIAGYLNQVLPLESSIRRIEGNIKVSINGSIRKYGEVYLKGVQEALVYLNQPTLFDPKREKPLSHLEDMAGTYSIPTNTLQGMSKGPNDIYSKIRLILIDDLAELGLSNEEIGGILNIRTAGTIRALRRIIGSTEKREEILEKIKKYLDKKEED